MQQVQLQLDQSRQSEAQQQQEMLKLIGRLQEAQTLHRETAE